MAAFNKVNSFITKVCAGTHANAINASTDTLKIYLSNATPDAALDLVKADLAEITAGNGYTAGGADTLNAASQSGATITLTATDVVWTASGGSIGPFQYVVLYNDTVTNDDLWGWWAYSSALTLAATDTFTVDFGATLATFA